MLSRYLFCLQVRTLSANDTEGVLGWFVLVISGGLLVNGYNTDILFEVLCVVMVGEPVNVNL